MGENAENVEGQHNLDRKRLELKEKLENVPNLVKTFSETRETTMQFRDHDDDAAQETPSRNPQSARQWRKSCQSTGPH